jgi:hypothetical protein
MTTGGYFPTSHGKAPNIYFGVLREVVQVIGPF